MPIVTMTPTMLAHVRHILMAQIAKIGNVSMVDFNNIPPILVCVPSACSEYIANRVIQGLLVLTFLQTYPTPT